MGRVVLWFSAKAESWWDMKGAFKQLRPEDVNLGPFKSGVQSPLMDLIYFEGNCKRICIDPAHTYAIDGVGKSYMASTIVLLALMGAWGDGSHEARFDVGYNRFLSFCTTHGYSTTIEDFSYETLKLKRGSCLAIIFKGKKIVNH